jgi:hypothetical protein
MIFYLLIYTGSKPGQGDGFFKGDKNPPHTFLSNGK